MRATDRWAIEERGVPSLDLMERAGAGLADLVTEVAPSGPRRRRLRRRQQRRRRLRRGAAARATPGARCVVATTTDPDEARGRREGEPRPLAGRRSCRSTPALLDGAAVAVDAILGTGFTRRGARAGARRRSSRSTRPTCRSSLPTCRAASTRRPARSRTSPCARRRPRRSTAPSPGLWIAPGQGARRAACASIDIGIPDGAPVDAGDRAARRRASLDAVPRPRRGVDEVLQRPRARRRRLDRADRRAVPGRRGRDARGRRLRDLLRARRR